MTSFAHLVTDIDGHVFNVHAYKQNVSFASIRGGCRKNDDTFSLYAVDVEYGFYYNSDLLEGDYKKFEEQFFSTNKHTLKLSADCNTLTLTCNNYTIEMKNRCLETETNIKQVTSAVSDYDIDKLRFEYKTLINIFNGLIAEKLKRK